MGNDAIIKILENHFCDVVKKQQQVGGGCIANTRVITFGSGKKVFVKSGFSNSMFLNEANGLKELAKAKAVRIPEVYLVSEDFIAMECIEPGAKQTGFYEMLGRQFAQMHRYTAADFGFYENNFIGSTPQMNIAVDTEKESWVDFYRNKRLRFQYNLAIKNGYGNAEFKTAFAKLENKMADILAGSDEPPCVLHGDLWGGNYMTDEKGEPVLIDPAVYYGHREADLAMTRLFGGFTNEFYAAYQNQYPLKEGWQYRENIYKLYHIMNHLNLFGAGYYSQMIDLIRYYV